MKAFCKTLFLCYNYSVDTSINVLEEKNQVHNSPSPSTIFEKIRILNGNVLKLLALILMTVDHIGLYIFPQFKIFRIIGRLAFPIFAYLVSEGATHTRNRARYLYFMLLIGVVTEIIFRIAMPRTSLNILITLSLSICIIYSFDFLRSSFRDNNTKKIAISMSIFCTLLILIFVIAYILPNIIAGYSGINYGICGVLLPFVAYLFKNRFLKLFAFAICLMLISIFNPLSCQIQLFSLLSIFLLTLYNGKRGHLKIKYLFYAYYPFHILLLYWISTIV